MTEAPDRRPAAVEPARPSHVDGWTTLDLRATRAMVPHVLDWLRARDPDRLLQTVAGWPPATRLALRHLLTTQGLAPLVADVLDRAGTEATAGPPGAGDTAAWLAGQLRQNRVRAARFADELRALLAGAAAAGIPLMPMKGAVVAFAWHREPGLRPMADLDVLVRPADEPVLHAVLVRLGYGLVSADDRRHRSYLRPGDRVVAMDGTHPDNPRSIQVHTDLQRSVWPDHGGVDVAPYLWAAGRETTLLGQPAIVPSDAALLVDIASHATTHLMHGTGMVLQWVDVASLAAAVPKPDDAFADWTYPAMALAVRAFPAGDLPSRLAGLASTVGPNLVRLAERAPLDDRAGLNLVGVQIERLAWFGARWRRWRPNPWLVYLAHPRSAPPLAYGAFLGGVGAHAARRMKRAAVGRRG